MSVRHEQGAAGAADGFARTTGRLGVCLTSTGPGAANAMGGQLEACVSSSPVLHLTGQIDSRFLDKRRGFIHEVPDQLGMMARFSKAGHRPPSADGVGATVAQAIVEAMTCPRGPVAVEIPIDFQYASSVLELGPLKFAALPASLRTPDGGEVAAQPRSSRDPGGPSCGQVAESSPPVRSTRCGCSCVAWVPEF